MKEKIANEEQAGVISVEKASIDDIDSLQRQCRALLEHVAQWSTTLDLDWIDSEEAGSYLASCIEDEGSTILKADIGGDMAGFAIGSTSTKPYRLERSFADLDFFYVNPDFRRQGVGEALLKGFTDWCLIQGVKVIRVETTYHNQEGQDFYHKRGFQNYELVLEKKL